MLRHEHYVNKTPWDKVKKIIKEIVVAILIALAIRAFLIEPYRIPTASMKPTILEGDMIMANKFLYGSKIPVLGLKLPAFTTPDTGDIVLFETPTFVSPGWFKELINFVSFGLFSGALDVNTADNPMNFIKRTIATPGDVLTLVNPETNNFQYQVMINGQKMLLSKYDYKGDFNHVNGDKLEYHDFYLEQLKDKKHIVMYNKAELRDGRKVFFPRQVEGDIYIPKEGDRLEFVMVESFDNVTEVKETSQSENASAPSIHLKDKVKLTVYKKDSNKVFKEIMISGAIISQIYYKKYEIQKGIRKNSIFTNKQLLDLVIKGKVTINSKESYYFMMGDNRDNSSDSRVWGLLNKSMVIGSPLFRHFPISRFGAVDRY